MGTTETVNCLAVYLRTSSPKVEAGKWLLKILKLAARLKNKTWTSSQIKNHKKNHELRLNRPHTQHKNPEHISLNS